MCYDPDDMTYELQSSVDILVATPGRLMDHINSTKGFTLEHLRYLVSNGLCICILTTTGAWLLLISNNTFRKFVPKHYLWDWNILLETWLFESYNDVLVRVWLIYNPILNLCYHHFGWLVLDKFSCCIINTWAICSLMWTMPLITVQNFPEILKWHNCEIGTPHVVIYGFYLTSL